MTHLSTSSMIIAACGRVHLLLQREHHTMQLCLLACCSLLLACWAAADDVIMPNTVSALIGCQCGAQEKGREGGGCLGFARAAAL